MSLERIFRMEHYPRIPRRRRLQVFQMTDIHLGGKTLHEIAEDEFNRIEPDYRDDSHFHPDFQALECGWRQLLVDRIADEHG